MQPPDKTVNICPSCGEKNNPTFSVCWKCGFQLPVKIVKEMKPAESAGEKPTGLFILACSFFIFGVQNFLFGAVQLSAVNFEKILAGAIAMQGFIFMVCSLGIFIRKRSFYLVTLAAVCAFVIEVFFDTVGIFIRFAAPSALLGAIWFVPVLLGLSDYFKYDKHHNKLFVWFYVVDAGNNEFQVKRLFSIVNLIVIPILIASVLIQLKFQN